MASVFVVAHYSNHQEGPIAAVFATEEKAVNYVETEGKKGFDMEYDEYEVW